MTGTSMRVRRWGALLGLTLLAGLLPAMTARAATSWLEVTKWQVDQATGTIVYDVTVHGTCETSRCSWELSGRYVDATVDQYQGGLGQGTVYTPPATFSKRVTGTLSGSAAREITHLRAKVTTSMNAVALSGLHRVSEPYAAPDVQLAIDKWQVDRSNGYVDYDVTLSATRLGQRYGPCDAVRCGWGIEAYYKDGSVQRLYHTLYSSSNSGDTMWTTSQRVTKTAFAAKEITHLRGYVAPYSCTSPCSYETAERWVSVSPPYPAPSVTLKVDKWQVDAAGSRVEYDLTLKATGLGQVNGPCDAIRCRWGIEGWYRDASGQRHQYNIYTGSNSGGTTWTVNHRAVSSLSSTLPVTHLRGYVMPYYDCAAPCAYESIDTGLIPVSGPAAVPGALNLVVRNWTADVDSGAASYDIEVSFSDDASSPACASGCSVFVDAFYKNGDIETFQGGAQGWGVSGPVRIWGTRAQGSISGEITHLRTTVTPTGGTIPAFVAWREVHAPYPAGSIEVLVESWQRDPVSGSVAFELSFSAERAGQVRGPCHENTCGWKVEAHHADGATTNLGSGQPRSGTWSVSHLVSGTVAVGGITHLSATLDSLCGADSVHSCASPWETYTTGPIPVSDFVVGDIDISPTLGFLAAQNVQLSELCLRAEEQARIMRVPDATPHTSPHSVTEACLGASNLPMALKLMMAAPGGAVVVGSIIISLDDDNPNQDAIAKVPSQDTDVIGSAVGLPPSCLDDAQRALLEQELEEGGWLQKHHAASDKHSLWTQAYKDLLAQHPWAADKTLGQEWNLMDRLPHRGNHPPAYHYWIYRNMEKALREATGWDSFVTLWKAWVTDVIRSDPTVVRWEWWRC